MLHDTIEDTETTRIEIEERFGKSVLQLILEVTDDKSLDKAERKRLQVQHAPQKSDLAKQLKIADKISNIRDISALSPVKWSLERKVEYLDWAERVVAGCRGVNSNLDDKFEIELQAARDRLSA